MIDPCDFAHHEYNPATQQAPDVDKFSLKQKRFAAECLAIIDTISVCDYNSASLLRGVGMSVLFNR
jgi:hypothetical protein